ncbi:MAG: response regulator [Candidatus Sericytochromatia bacterium]|nr:response regulator [Candidatus Tanganyikabacteria bacterium]
MTEETRKYTLLVVDDELDNLELLQRTLRRDYRVVPANSGEEALEKLPDLEVDLIITDQRMPGMTGIGLLEKAAEMGCGALGIILTGYTDAQDLMEAINSGYVYRYITKPWEPEELKLTLKRALESHAMSAENKRLMRQLRDNHFRVLATLVTALEAKDPYSAGHSHRVKDLALAVGERIGLSAKELEDLGEGALLHDIGEIGVREEVLNKPGKLTEEEFEHVKSHVRLGADMLSFVEEFAGIIPLVQLHHERLDGSGYPFGLKGDQIPMLARILAVVDTFDALVSDRPHRPALARSRAIAVLQQGRGREFDEQVVDTLLHLLAHDPRFAEATAGEAAQPAAAPQ